MFDAKLFIGGKSVAASNEAQYDRIDPITNLIATRASAASVEDAIEAANSAASAFPLWSTTASSFRQKILNDAADLLEQRRDEFSQVMADEIGASQVWSNFNCNLAASVLRDAAQVCDRIGASDAPSSNPGVKALLVRQPAGVVLSIAPWNAPIVLGVRAVAVPLACGNTVVLKASELCPKTHSLIVETLYEAGLPPGALNLVTNAPDTSPDIVKALIAHPAVRRINFTGSTRIGRMVAEHAAHHLKPCLLELSGKAPLIVLDDADIDEAVKAAAFGAFFNQGQICMSTERIIVDLRIADTFVEKFVEKARSLVAGDPRSGRYALGSMISREAVLRVKGLVEEAVRKGATLLCGGEADHTIMQPVVLDGVTSTMSLYSEESFGPVAAIIRVDGTEEAISVANDTEFALAAAIYGKNTKRALEVANQIESGVCHINAPTVYDDPQMPFGGTKASGYGRFGGESGFNEFTELRWISVHEADHDFPI